MFLVAKESEKAMNEDIGTAELRRLASNWSLQGDKHLLEVLQNIHKTLVTQCKNGSAELNRLAASLDTASNKLDIVNNKLSGLSSCQFVESCVSEDDSEGMETPIQHEEPRKSAEVDPLEEMRRSIRILQSLHEPLRILPDSDSDTDSDDDLSRLVLRPIDMYRSRPLPYIIGTPEWNAKMHVGLVEENSEGSSSSDHGLEVSENEMDSDPELSPNTHINIQKETKDKLQCSRDLHLGEPQLWQEQSSVTLPQTPQEVQPTPVPHTTQPWHIQHPYPVPSFSEGPPPLFPSDQSDSNSYQTDNEEDDLFVGLHKDKPQLYKETPQNTSENFAPSCLQDAGNEKDIKADRDDAMEHHKLGNPPPIGNISRTATNDNVHKINENTHDIDERDSSYIKKPIGGISVFGSNKSTESITAVILKRSQNKDNIEIPAGNTESIDDSKSFSNQTEKTEPQKKSKESLLDDLFPTSQIIDKNEQEAPKKNFTEINKPNIFSDDLFDDIDNIFSSSVKDSSNTKGNNNRKSIFDDDCDELFADVTDFKSDTRDKKTPKNDLFDDIFIDEPVNITEQLKPKIDQTGPKISNILFEEGSEKELFFDKTSKYGENKSAVKNSDGDSDKLNILSCEREYISDKSTSQESKKNLDKNSKNIKEEKTIGESLLTSNETNIKDSTYIDSRKSLGQRDNKSDLNANDLVTTTDECQGSKSKIEKVAAEQCIKTPETAYDCQPALKSKLHDKLEKSKILHDFSSNSLFDTIHESIFNSNNNHQIETNSECASDNLDPKYNIFKSEPPQLLNTKKSDKAKDINSLFSDSDDDEILFSHNNDNSFDDFSTEADANNMCSPSHETLNLTMPLPTNKKEDESPVKAVSGVQKQHINFNSDIHSSKDIKIHSSYNVQSEDKFSEPQKTIGKLKPLNLNINVNTLLPGASIKETPKNPFHKTSSFDVDNEKTESEKSDFSSLGLLDNKISKDRAKIQIKRRPSTRRARIEAVRKSTIEFRDDSIDSEATVEKSQEIETDESTNNMITQPTVNSKIVYVLHDEDIFSITDINKNETAEILDQSLTSGEKDVEKSTTLKLQEDNEDFFKSITEPTKNITKTDFNIKTLGNLYVNTEHFFNKENIEDDLFSNIESDEAVKKTESVHSRDKPKQTRKSLFDDLSDDDDLFIKSNKTNTTPNSAKIYSKKEVVHIEEKKSLFDDDDDDDDNLFKIKK